MAGIDSYTKLCANFNGADASQVYTAETGQSATFVNQAQLDTAQYKFGSASLLLDGTGDLLRFASSADYNLTNQNFVIECWVRYNSTTGFQGLFERYVTGDTSWYLHKSDAHKLTFGATNASTVVASYVMQSAWAGLATNTWYHIALVRSGTSIYIFINGVPQTLTVTTAIGTTSLNNSAQYISIGSYGATAFDTNGWIDTFRLSIGTDRGWTSDFSASLPSEYSADATGGFMTTNKGWM
jgi:hypothetical protein